MSDYETIKDELQKQADRGKFAYTSALSHALENVEQKEKQEIEKNKQILKMQEQIMDMGNRYEILIARIEKRQQREQDEKTTTRQSVVTAAASGRVRILGGLARRANSPEPTATRNDTLTSSP